MPRIVIALLLGACASDRPPISLKPSDIRDGIDINGDGEHEYLFEYHDENLDIVPPIYTTAVYLVRESDGDGTTTGAVERGIEIGPDLDWQRVGVDVYASQQHGDGPKTTWTAFEEPTVLGFERDGFYLWVDVVWTDSRLSLIDGERSAFRDQTLTSR